MAKETYEEALSYIGERMGGGYGVEHGMGRQFGYVVPQLIEEEVPFDLENQQISGITVGEDIKERLLTAKAEEWDYDRFQGEVKEYATEIIQSDMTEYTIYFPLNLKDYQPIPDSFSIVDLDIDRIEIEEWNEYKRLSQIQKELLQDYFGKPQVLTDEEDFTFWKCKVSANDALYASYDFQRKIDILLGKILYSYGRRHLFGGKRSDNLPRSRGELLSSPQILLCFDEYSLESNIVNYEFQEPTTIPLLDDTIEARFDALPNLDSDTKYDELLRMAFRLYFHGVTEERMQNSYFTFIRGIEQLAQKEKSQSLQLAIDRALLARSIVDDDDLQPWFEDILDNFDSKRNAIAHEGPHTPLHKTYQDLAKLLFVDLLTVYLVCYDEFDAKKVGDMLKYGVRAVNRGDLLEKFESIDSPHLDD